MTGGDGRGPSGTGGLPIRRDAETDGCSCLDCRNVDAATTRRSLFDTVRWGWRLCRAYPSVLVLGAALVTMGTLVDTVGVRVLPTPVVSLLSLVVTVGFFVGLRAYVATLAARELTGSTLSPWPWCRRAIGRALLLVAVLLGLVFALSMLSTVVTTVLFGVLLLADVQSALPSLGQPAFFAVIATSVVVLVAPLLLMVFKCWFALEACLIGRYGPIDAVRVSWGMTTAYRRKLLRLVAAVVVTLGISYVDGVTPSLSGDPGTLLTGLQTALGALGQLSAVLWFAVTAHLYVQSIVDS
ncbi:hypothetical protein [Haloarcula laminariae]|uniref:hypothetical protein n=1 Tax=Haloarcula laminariae TaxID=2961577 RepID=UPI0021C7DB04|nr:hypothetical protein [Halomicroarcula laminariae]